MASAVAQTASVASCRVSLSSKKASSVAFVNVSALTKGFDGLRLSAAVTSKATEKQGLTAGATNSSRAVVTMGVEAGIGVLGNKVGMLTLFTDDGKAVPCTVIGFHEGNVLTQVKTEDTDGYNAVQVRLSQSVGDSARMALNFINDRI